jgi:glycine/D-amino acid oxidase-like deaminating enzyme
MPSVAVIGSGVFGVSAAKELRRRGYEVTLFDPGPVPHRLAESTDISKIVRLDYGDDEAYTLLMEGALERWRSSSLAPFFHETGVLFLRRSPLEPGGFEHDSFELLSRRGHRLERLDREAVLRRFPSWASEGVEGYLNPEGGWVESGNVVRHLVREARDAGVRFADGVAVARLLESDSRVLGVVTEGGEGLRSDFVVVAAGSWTPHLLPFMKDHLRSVGQPVFHLAPTDPSRFGERRFPVFAADISRTGYYGFPASPEGIIKIANHGVGRAMHPESGEREVQEEESLALRAFLREWLPELAPAAITSTRVCVYCDTHDQHFWIAPDPERLGLVVAAGGSGHAFKFTPLLGEWIGDAVEGKVIPRFGWRSPSPGAGEERARHQTRPA